MNYSESTYHVVKWLANGERGLSSECMAFWLGFGIKPNRIDYPFDQADFMRCLLLLDAAPHLRPKIVDMSALSSEWAAIALHWDAIERCLLDEVGLGWSIARRAPKTYALMRTILER